MTTVVLFGHSHLGAIERAYPEAKSTQAVTFDLHMIQCIRKGMPHIIHGPQGWEYNPNGITELLAAVETSSPSAVFWSLQGEQSVWAGMLSPERPFDFFLPGEPRSGGALKSEVVAFDIVMEVAKGHHQLASTFLDKVQPRLAVPAFGLCPPPPVGDSDYMMDRMRSFEIFPKLQERGLAPAVWRQKIWKVHTLALDEIYTAHGCGFVAPPAGALDDEGCLLPSLYSDAFHANKNYGSLVLAQMQEIVDQMTR